MPPSFKLSIGVPLTTTGALIVSVNVADCPRPITPLAGVAATEATVGAAFSSEKVSAAEPVLPARSVSAAVTVLAPGASPAGVNCQAPLPSAVVVPRIVLPSARVTRAFGSPLPDSGRVAGDPIRR